MNISSVCIQNFRKLYQCHIDFSNDTTLFVGANNSGKTSAMDALGKFLAGRPFAFNDITISNRELINQIGKQWETVACEKPNSLSEWGNLLPSLDVWLNVNPQDMAASRFGFANLYSALDECKLFGTALRKGEIPEISFLSNTVSPLIKAHKADNAFEVSRLIHKSSPLLSKKSMSANIGAQQEMLEKAEQASVSLFALWDNDANPLCIEVLKNINASGLYELTERTNDILDENYVGDDPKVIALKKALSVPFDEMERYATYVSDSSRFATHQGVKGLEFPRVMVILDDTESRGFLFSYEKLFGAKKQTATDLKNEKEGKDTSNRRTARLFYVACTRAMESLAVVAYSDNPELVKNTALNNGWFSEDEIQIIETQSVL